MNNKIVAFGDSLIKGNPEPENGGWVQRCFNNDLIKGRAQLIIKGVGGDNILNLLNRVETDCLKHSPSGVILGIGVNDSRVRDSLNGANEVPIDDFEKDLKRLYQILFDNGIKSIFVVTPLPVLDKLSDPFKPDKRYQKKWVKKYRDIILNVSKDNRIHIFDNWNEWDNYNEDKLATLLPDGVHPSENAYNLISNQALENLDMWLKAMQM